MTGGEEIRSFLEENGAAVVGFASAEPFGEWQAAFERALESGLMPGMYAGRLRGDPGSFLPGARSLVVFGVPFPGLAEVLDPSRGSIAGIAWARKQERELSGRLAAMLEQHGSRAVDAVGLPAKAAAARAGLAVCRKNSLAYFPDSGSAMRIGVVATDIELEGGPSAAPNDCGDCRACLEACPTGALGDEGRLDVARCICFLLEHDSDLPGEMYPMIGNKIIGCEECQLACPHNRDVPRLSLEEVGWLDLAFLAGESAERPASLLSWLREDMCLPVESDSSLLRALAVALGNAGSRSSAKVLEKMASSGYPDVADAARWSLERLTKDDAQA